MPTVPAYEILQALLPHILATEPSVTVDLRHGPSGHLGCILTVTPPVHACPVDWPDEAVLAYTYLSHISDCHKQYNLRLTQLRQERGRLLREAKTRKQLEIPDPQQGAMMS